MVVADHVLAELLQELRQFSTIGKQLPQSQAVSDLHDASQQHQHQQQEQQQQMQQPQNCLAGTDNTWQDPDARQQAESQTDSEPGQLPGQQLPCAQSTHEHSQPEDPCLESNGDQQADQDQDPDQISYLQIRIQALQDIITIQEQELARLSTSNDRQLWSTMVNADQSTGQTSGVTISSSSSRSSCGGLTQHDLLQRWRLELFKALVQREAATLQLKEGERKLGGQLQHLQQQLHTAKVGSQVGPAITSD